MDGFMYVYVYIYIMYINIHANPAKAFICPRRRGARTILNLAKLV
jgi:hypothetical protein